MLEDALDGDPHRGIAALAIDGDRETFASVGARDHDGHGTIEKTTVFPIGSVSKTFVGLLLSEALMRGEVSDLDAPVEHVWDGKLPLPRGKTRSISWDDLATHRAGFPFFPTNWKPSKEEHRAGYTLEEFRSFLSGFALASEPGTTAVYGNTGFALLAMSLAEVAQRPFSDLLRERIFVPLGMTSSSFPDREESPPPGYLEGWGVGCQPQPWKWDPSPMAPCCVVRSTLSDLSRLARALMTPGSPWNAHLERIRVPRAGTPWGMGESFGHGVTTRPNDGLVFKDGQVEGVRTFLLLEPARRRALVVVANTYRVDIGDLAFRAWDVFKGDRSGELTVSTATSSVPTQARAIDERLSDDIVMDGIVAPAFAAPGETVELSVYLTCRPAHPEAPALAGRPYRFYSDLWLGKENGRILRTQRLAKGLTCDVEGKQFRHDLRFTLPRSDALRRAELWVGLTATDHEGSPPKPKPNADTDGSLRHRAARIVVIDRANVPKTWDAPP